MPPSSPSSPERRRGRLVVLAGPGGSGKSTIVAELRRRIPLHFSVSVTTRAARPGEQDGVHYRFVEEPAFRRMIDDAELLEWAEYNGHLYGTPRRPVEDELAAGHDVLLEIDVQGARQIRSLVPEALLVFVAPPSIEDLKERLEGRGDTSPADIAAKVAIARRELAEAAALFDHIVVNDRVDRAVAAIVEILTEGPPLFPPPGE